MSIRFSARHPAPRLRLLALAPILATGAAGCASAGRLGEYDFTDRTVAVVTTSPPRPEILTGDVMDLTGESAAEALFRIGTGIVKDYQASRTAPRLDSAVAAVDVAGRMSGRLLEQGARQLRARPVESVDGSDFEIEVRVKRYGIEADDWDSQARFFMEADVFILDGVDGRRIWKAGVDESEPINRGAWGGSPGMDAVLTASALAGLSRYEMERTLEYLADYCADRVADKLRKGLEKARG